MVDDHQQRMAPSHQRLLTAQSLDEAIDLAAQVAVLLHAGAPSRLHKGRAQIGVALARAARQALAAAPFVAGTDSFCRQSSTCHSGARPSPAWLPIVHENVFENGSGLEE